MDRLLKTSLLSLLFLAACAKSPGFKAEDYRYELVKNPLLDPAEKTQKTGTSAPAQGTVVRNSNRITFTPTKSKWENQKLIMNAQVKFGDDSYGEVEFQGVKKDSKVFMVPTKPELKDKVKAQVICTSELGCDEFFIDIFINNENILYHDQVLSTLVTPQPVETDSQPQAETPPKKTPAPVPPPPAADETLVPDELKEEEMTRMGYVGTSDEEAREAFQIKPPTKEEKAQEPQPKEPSKDPKGKDEVPKDSPTQPPAKEPVPKKEEPPPKPSPQQSQTQKSALEKLRVMDQIIKKPNAGFLDRATDFQKLSGLAGFYFFVTQPEQGHHFGSFDLARVLHVLGETLNQMLPGRKLAVTEVSKFGGGKLCFKVQSGRKVRTKCHASHQSGIDADIRYLRHDENKSSNVVKSRGQVDNNFLTKEQWNLFKAAFATGEVELIFVDPAVKKAMCAEAKRANDFTQGQDDSLGAQILQRLYAVSGHYNHFHIRVKCSSDNPRCHKIIYSKKPVGC